MNGYCLTDTGLVRKHNEDSVLINKNLNNDYLLVVADGMGGHRAGDVASAICIDIIGKAWSKVEGFKDRKEALKWLNSIFMKVNQHILDYANDNEDCLGMGTTLTVALVFEDYTVIGHVGDSRCYVLTKKMMHQITTDHSLVNHLIKTKEITEEEAQFHPKKNVLMKAVGTNRSLEVDYFDFKNDYCSILLCSDGLTNLLTNEEIFDILVNHKTTEFRVDRLVNSAKDKGGYDNISVALLEVGEFKDA